MKDIKAILAEHELGDEVRAAIERNVRENYRTISEVTQKAERISELEKQNGELSEQVKALEGDGEQLEALRKQVADFEAAETARMEAEAEKAKRDSFRSVFDKAVGEREFANQLVEDTVFERVYKACQCDTGLGAKEALDTAVKDADGIWKNPQKDPAKMPNPDDVSAGRQKTAQEVKDERTIADFILGRK